MNEVAEVSLLDILIILAERKRLILWITGAFAVIAIVTSLLLPQELHRNRNPASSSAELLPRSGIGCAAWEPGKHGFACDWGPGYKEPQ